MYQRQFAAVTVHSFAGSAVLTNASVGVGVQQIEQLEVKRCNSNCSRSW